MPALSLSESHIAAADALERATILFVYIELEIDSNIRPFSKLEVVGEFADKVNFDAVFTHED